MKKKRTPAQERIHQEFDRWFASDAARRKALSKKSHEGQRTFGKEAKEAKEQIADYLKREPTRRDY